MTDEPEQPTEHALVPVREQAVDFYGDTLLTAQTTNARHHLGAGAPHLRGPRPGPGQPVQPAAARPGVGGPLA